ncbi:MAG: hypothetical protein COT92_02980 [Candidatus Doudnabacteria bacterium CG10_big_fil_rev_8_21_14_0_10_42_18]|uniref:Uncharacterized protein n=1 Tax=Candidatus Doudnabacteria bacterium CG10_big_fil_rev_8_21_14_0_10_42_18 TaxID=1974552 RepID=A0A2H0VAF7_9BACT|nr:MAG: hypothetical protein COT92_02980 [Candidatus Doudnabacteria bacterium CG10_big_fil_rev_8_21_14_0_10_42_18]
MEKQKGFALIAVLLAIVIIAVIAVSLWSKSKNDDKRSLPEIKQQAEADTQKINQDLQNYQDQINAQQ